MSHFTVMVIGDNVEEQLAPFHEFECTGNNDQYVIDVDITDKVLATKEDDAGGFDLGYALKYFDLDDFIVASEDEVDREGDHQYRYAVVQDGKLVKAVDRTNPNAKWDWWVVGGRWTDFFKLKDGAEGKVGRPGIMTKTAPEGHADSALKRDIDFASMRDEASNKAGDLWDKVRAATEHTISSFQPWEFIREKYKGDIEKARKVYHEQPAILSLRSNEELRWNSLEDFVVDRESYVQDARDAAGVSFAVIKDGEWFERGSMGWWGCVSDEKDKGDWHKEFAAMLDSLPDDTRLTIVDCHI